MKIFKSSFVALPNSTDCTGGLAFATGEAFLFDMNNPNLTGGGVIHDTPLYSIGGNR